MSTRFNKLWIFMILLLAAGALLFGARAVESANKHSPILMVTEDPVTEQIPEKKTLTVPVMSFTPDEAEALILRFETEREEAKKAEEESKRASRYLGRFLCTSYCPCYYCSEGYGSMTSTGVRARANHTIAVDPRVIPYGTWVVINGLVYRAEDCGGGVKGNHIDVYFETHSESMRWNMGYYDVYLYEG